MTSKALPGREILAQRAVWGKAQSMEKKRRHTRAEGIRKVEEVRE